MTTPICRTDSNCIRFDWAAKNILRDKADFTILEALVSAVIGEKITITELLESESNQKTKDDKFNRVDIKAKNRKGEIILIEVQLSTELYFLQRVLFGVAKTITEHLKLGKNYRKVKKVYSINILYFDFGEGEDYLYHGSNSLIGVNTGDQLKVTADERHGIETVLSEKVFPEYYLLRVEKYDQEEASNAREEWMRYLKWGYIDPETKVPGLKEAYERLLELKMTPKERKAYEEHLEAIMYQNDVLGADRRDGRIEGRVEGLAEGKELGFTQAKLETAQKMLNKGIDLKTICEVTGLSEEQIGKNCIRN